MGLFKWFYHFWYDGSRGNCSFSVLVAILFNAFCIPSVQQPIVVAGNKLAEREEDAFLIMVHIEKKLLQYTSDNYVHHISGKYLHFIIQMINN